MVLFEKDIQVGSLYILLSYHGYFIGRAVGVSSRYSVKKILKSGDSSEPAIKEVGSPQYMTVTLKGVDDYNIERFGMIKKLFKTETSKEQMYVTNHLLFDDLFLKFDSYSWLVNHMLKLNEFKLDRRNINISYKIALSMFYKEAPLVKKNMVDKFIEPLFRNTSEEISDEIE